MTVSVLSLAERGAEEISVTFALQSGEHIQKESFLLSVAQVADLRLHVGGCDRACYESVEYAARLHRAQKCALQILSYGDCSEKMLCRKLVMKGISREVAEDAVAELCLGGWLNPAESARREVERCVAKLWGRRRIAAALYEKGYSDATTKEAMRALSEVDEVELCVRRIEKRTGGIPTDPADRRKLIASLERYGFLSSQIKEAFTRILQN
ncbi:MAG: RecX family transcriptional regulator [Clostridia bacterium]|nr:RecX family transcriptional regulator [Clostridia bacterium]